MQLTFRQTNLRKEVINLPRGYEKMRDKFIKDGMSKDEAQEKAARIWNSKHKDDLVTKKNEENFDEDEEDDE
jgi:hypothetical protein